MQMPERLSIGRWLERLALASPFRWRIEWVLLLTAAASLVLTEQSCEALEREPAVIVRQGEHARAGVLAARHVHHTERIGRGQTRQITRTVVDLEWTDTDGRTRRVSDHRVADEIAADLGIDAFGQRWPEYARIVYLGQPLPPPSAGPSAEAVLPRDAAGPPCQPVVNCSLVMLDNAGRSGVHEEVERMNLVLDWGPAVQSLALAGFLALLVLRLAGIVHNRPSLE